MTTKGAELLVESDRRADTWQIPNDIWLTDDLPPAKVDPHPGFLAGMRPPNQHRGLEPIVGPWLKWSPLSALNQRKSPPADGCLDKFVKLANAKPSEILTFARKWGPLGICEHGKPANHNKIWFMCAPLGMRPGGSERSGVPEFLGSSGYAWDSVPVWRRIAEEAGTVLIVAAALKEETPISEDDVVTLHRAAYKERPSADELWLGTHTSDWANHLLMTVADRWLKAAHIELTGRYDSLTRTRLVDMVVDRPNESCDLHYGGLFGALAIQLATALTSSRGVFRCQNPECGRPYALAEGKNLPKRGPTKPRHFCPECQRDNLVARKLSARDRRERTTVSKRLGRGHVSNPVSNAKPSTPVHSDP